MVIGEPVEREGGSEVVVDFDMWSSVNIKPIIAQNQGVQRRKNKTSKFLENLR